MINKLLDTTSYFYHTATNYYINHLFNYYFCISSDLLHHKKPLSYAMYHIGTSMASPGAAGTALLIRQYFSDSGPNFWNSLCNKKYLFCKSFLPSGVLVKAILLHSGSQMIKYDGGQCNCGLPTTILSAPPDSIQGYGRITLNNVLPLANKFIFDLFVDDLVTIQANSMIMYHTHVTSSSTPFK